MRRALLRVVALCTGAFSAATIPTIARAQWAPDGTPVCTATQAQSAPTAASDGAGGVILAWTDLRDGNLDVYAQRLNAAGAALWAPDGVPVCTARGDQGTPSIAADGSPRGSRPPCRDAGGGFGETVNDADVTPPEFPM